MTQPDSNIKKIITKFAKYVRHNPDPHSFLMNDIDPTATVSPKLVAAMRDKPVVKWLKELSIYNMACLGYQDKVWSFVIVLKNGRQITNTVGKLEFGEPILFEDAINHSLLKAFRLLKEEADAIKNRQVEIDAEIEYPADTFTDEQTVMISKMRENTVNVYRDSEIANDVENAIKFAPYAIAQLNTHADLNKQFEDAAEALSKGKIQNAGFSGQFVK